MSEPTRTPSDQPGDNQPDLPKELLSFFDQFQPTPFDPATCHSESRLQEMAMGKRPTDSHAADCPHCSYIIATLEKADASKEQDLYQFMEAIRARADAERKKPSQRATFWEGILARLRSDSGFRLFATGATAAILLAIAVMVPNLWPSRDTSVAVQMPVQDEGRYLLAVQQMKDLRYQNMSNAQLGVTVHEINRLIQQIDTNKLTPMQRGQLAEQVHDLSLNLRLWQASAIVGTSPVEMAGSDDIKKVDQLHEALARLAPGQVQDGQIDVREISQDHLVVAGPFKHEQLQPGDPVYKVLANYAVSEKTDVGVQVPDGQIQFIRASALVPKQ